MHKESHQHIDIVSMFKPVTKWNVRLQSSRVIPEVVRKAFKVAQAQKPGPTHIELPEDVMADLVDAAPLPVAGAPAPAGAERPRAARGGRGDPRRGQPDRARRATASRASAPRRRCASSLARPASAWPRRSWARGCSTTRTRARSARSACSRATTRSRGSRTPTSSSPSATTSSSTRRRTGTRSATRRSSASTRSRPRSTSTS